MKKRIKHAVVIVNYNGWEDTLLCLESIAKCKDTPHVIVVDNASTNESVVELKKKYPDLDLIESQTNLGFAGGNNVGIKKALKMGAQVIYLLNNDTVVDPQLFFRAYRATVGKKRFIGGKIYYAKGYEYYSEQKGKGNILWYAGGHIDWQNAIAVHDGVDEEDKGQFSKQKHVDFITGCFIAIPRRMVQKIGLLSDDYFLYLEDTDYCIRAVRQNVELVYNPSLIIYHRNGSSTGAGSRFVDYYMTRNRLIIGRKFGDFRLRFALWREAVVRNWKDPIRRAAFMDFVMHKWGNQNTRVESLLEKEV